MGLVKGDDSSDELLQAQALVWNNIFGFINSMSLKTAVELGIPEIIHAHSNPITIHRLLAALRIHPTKTQFVYQLMRILVHSGLFALETAAEDGGEQGYVLTSASKLLLKDNPLSIAPFIHSMLDPVVTKPWHQLGTWYQNGDASTFDVEHGMSFWEYAGRDPKLNDSFNEAMASDARLESRVLIDKCKDVFAGVSSLVDVGGGTGTLAGGIAENFPDIECTVFDQPHVVADLKSQANLKFVGGDMFESIPPVDAVLLKCVLHNWSDEECLEILKNCKKAIAGSGGKVKKIIIIDMVLESRNRDAKFTETQLFMDMLMMVLLKAKERTEDDWAELFLEAGFSNYRISHLLGLRSLIEIYP